MNQTGHPTEPAKKEEETYLTTQQALDLLCELAAEMSLAFNQLASYLKEQGMSEPAIDHALGIMEDRRMDWLTEYTLSSELNPEQTDRAMNLCALYRTAAGRVRRLLSDKPGAFADVDEMSCQN